ncbi:MAG: MarR family transcriptional regulator [Clostridia bacterium]
MNKNLEKQLKETYISWNSINGLYSTWAKKRGVNAHTLFTLYAIYNDRDNCCQSKICDEWFMPKQTVSSILKELERKGCIFYESDANDRRNKIIKLTDSGLSYADGILGKLYGIEVSVLDKMGSELRQNMIDANNLFYKLLKEEMVEDELEW